jgi:iron complex outermembrane recepter protein
MTIRSVLTGTVASAALLAIAMPGTASAQAAGSTTDENGVETIVVTARKKEETLVTAPVAVTAVGAADIERLQIQSVDDLARFTPGLSFSKAFGRSSDRPVLRGAANILATVQAGVESGTAFFVDGIYYQGDIQSLDQNEILRVEVIKGPQSALYGRNTYSGAINYITRNPGDTLAINGRVTAADHGEINASLRVSGPITDTLSGAISGRYYTYDGEWLNSSNPGELLGSEQTVSYSGVLDWQPTDEFSVRLRASFTEDDDGPRAFGFQSSNSNNCMAGYRSNQFRGAAASTNNNGYQYYCGVIRDQGIYFQNTVTRPGDAALVTPPFIWRGVAGAPFMGVHREVFFGSFAANLELDSGYTFTVQGGMRDETRQTGSDSDFLDLGQFFPGPGQTAGVVAGVPHTNALFQTSGELQARDFSLEVRVASPQDRRLRWLVGAYAYDLEQDSIPLNWFFGSRGSARGPVTATDGTFNSAVFARVSFDFTERLSLDVEARSASERKVTREFGDGTTAARPFGGLLYSDNQSFDAVTPRVTLNWNITDSSTLYGIYAKGAKPGGLNGLIGQVNNRARYEQEESTNLEIGYKTEFLDRRGYIALAAYQTTADQYQLTTSIADTSGASATGLTSVVTNQGDAEIRGFEAELRFRVTDNLRLSATYSYVDTEFTAGCDEFQYVLESGGFLMSPTCDVPARTTPVSILSGVATPIAGASGSIVGNRIPLVPETQWSFNADYSREIFNGWEFFASADVSYESSKYVQVHNMAETGDTTLVGARMGIGNDMWRISVFGRNLTDEDSIPIATRWFDLFQGSATAAGIPAAQQVGIDTGSPRGFFFSPRKGRTLGAEIRFSY